LIISEQNIIDKLFDKKNIKDITPINFYFSEKKKIIVFVPEKDVENIFKAMGKTGAGKIGNYKLCSFRTYGTGTFFPLKGANPAVGKSGKLESVKEVKLEMECNENDLNKIIDVMMSSHPYEEVAYEIYDFKRRTEYTDGVIIRFNKPIDLNNSLGKVNPLFKNDRIFKEKITTLGIYSRENTESDLRELKKLKIQTVLYKTGKNLKIVKI